MITSFIGWIFDLFGKLWDGFWNVCGKLFGLVLLTALCGVAGAIVAKLLGHGSDGAWHAFKLGACIGFLVGGLRLIINEVAVPLVHAQEKRLRESRRREIDIEVAKARALSARESVSKRLKHLH